MVYYETVLDKISLPCECIGKTLPRWSVSDLKLRTATAQIARICLFSFQFVVSLVADETHDNAFCSKNQLLKPPGGRKICPPGQPAPMAEQFLIFSARWKTIDPLTRLTGVNTACTNTVRYHFQQPKYNTGLTLLSFLRLSLAYPKSKTVGTSTVRVRAEPERLLDSL